MEVWIVSTVGNILNNTDLNIEKIRAEEHFRRERGDEANKLIEREAGKETSVGSTSDHFSQILRHTDTTFEKIRETITKNEYGTNVSEPEDRKDELIVVTSTLDKYSGKVGSPVKEELKDIELKKSKDKLQLHLVKKDGVFTIEKKSRKHSGRRKKRKTVLNFKTDNCNICKFCNVSIMIWFKLCVRVISAFLGGFPTNCKYYFQCDLTTASVPLLLLWDSVHNVRASNCRLMADCGRCCIGVFLMRVENVTW